MDMQSFMIHDWKLSRSVRGVYCTINHTNWVCVFIWEYGRRLSYLSNENLYKHSIPLQLPL
jgi:hypothetical protein